MNHLRYYRPILTITVMSIVAAGLPAVVPLAPQAERAPATPHTEPYPAWDVVLVAHRGLSPGLPENTLAAFRNSIALGVDVIELDLRGTADGEVVVLHDETVDRTTDGTGAVTELTLAEVRALDAGGYVGPSFRGERVPTYREVLELVQGAGTKLLLDIKPSEVLDKERVVRLTEEYGATLDVIVGVRSVADLREFRALNPNLRTLGFVPDRDSIGEFAHAGVDIIRLWADWIFDDRDSASCRAEVAEDVGSSERDSAQEAGSRSCLVRAVHELGRPVWSTAGTLPREALDELIRLRVNGILTDLPEVLAELLAEIEAERAGG